MKPGEMKRLKLNDSWGKREGDYFCLGETYESYIVISLYDGHMSEFDKSHIVEEQIITVDSAVKKLMESYYNDYLKSIGLKTEAYKMFEQADSLMEDHDIEKVLAEVQGHLVPDVFKKTFLSKLPVHVKEKLSGYQCYIANDGMVIRYQTDIQPHCTDATMVEVQDDGLVEFKPEAKETEMYKEFMKQYSNRLPIEQSPVSEDLSIEDFDCLTYNCVYGIEFEKDLTYDYARELALAFAK